MALQKKSDDLQPSPLPEVDLSVDDWDDLERGVILFNQGKFHLVQEVLSRIVEQREEGDFPFVEGIIQLAIAYHAVLSARDVSSARESFSRAIDLLEPFQPQYMGVYTKPIVRLATEAEDALLRLGPRQLDQFNERLVPTIRFDKPREVNLTDEIHRMRSSGRFVEGTHLFNQGYFWEAHEVWEEVWRLEEGDTKILAQAFVQMAAGYSFLKQNKVSSAAYLFGKTLEKFQRFSDGDIRIEVRHYTKALQRALEGIRERLTSKANAGRKPISVPVISAFDPEHSPTD
jgi:predicted metal-dependent hydrolase